MDSVTFQGWQAVDDTWYVFDAHSFDTSASCAACVNTHPTGKNCWNDTIDGKYGEAANHYIIPRSSSSCHDIKLSCGRVCGYRGTLAQNEMPLTDALAGPDYQDALNDFKSLANTTQYLVYNDFARDRFSKGQTLFDAEVLVLQCQQDGKPPSVCQPHGIGEVGQVSYQVAAGQLVSLHGTAAQKNQWTAASSACQEAAAATFFQSSFASDGVFVGTVDELINFLSPGTSPACKPQPPSGPTEYIGVLGILGATAAIAYLIIKTNK